MRHIEPLSGEGTVTAPNEQTVSVRYRVDILEDEVPVRTLNGTTPGKKSIQGRIEPLCFFGRAGLILRMADGRTLRFYFADADGNIVACGGIT
jgi:hypothetical protein